MEHNMLMQIRNYVQISNVLLATLVLFVVTTLLPASEETVVEAEHLPLVSPQAEPSLAAATVPAIEACGIRLLQNSGRIGTEARKLPALYIRNSVNKEIEFLEYMFSVIYVESRFDRNAHSDMDARGLMQMTLPAVQDAVVHCRLRPILDMDHMFDSATNIRYGSCYLRKLLGEMDGDWTRTLIAYNGGYMQLMRYDRGDDIATETANYVLKVNKALHDICLAQ